MLFYNRIALKKLGEKTIMTLAALTFTITMGWWIIPAIITLSLLIALIKVALEDTNGWGAGIMTIGFFLFAFGVSSFSWLIWALCMMRLGN